MYGVELLKEEHVNILKFIEVLERKCCEIIDKGHLDIDFFRESILFGRNYADAFHHGKEEKILFRVMEEKLGSTAQKLIRNGMLVEHDLGRYHTKELEHALDRYEKTQSVMDKLQIIVHAGGYADLLKRHIAKEDEVVYTYAVRMLDEDTKQEVDDLTQKLLEEESQRQIEKKYLLWLQNVL